MKLSKVTKQVEATGDFKLGSYFYRNHTSLFHHFFKKFMIWFRKNIHPRYELNFLDEPMEKDEEF